MHGKLSNFTLALEDFTKALDLHTQSAPTYRERTLIYKHTGETDRAQRAVHKANQLDRPSKR